MTSNTQSKVMEKIYYSIYGFATVFQEHKRELWAFYVSYNPTSWEHATMAISIYQTYVLCKIGLIANQGILSQHRRHN